MSTTVFSLLVIGMILIQVAGFAAFKLYRYQARYQALECGDTAVRVPAAVPGPSRHPTESPAWTGYRDFVVRRRITEDAAGSVCSYYLFPVDGEPLPDFRPGQYLTFALDLPAAADQAGKPLVRCYSLSDRPRPDCYRVSIKRIPAPPGRPELTPGRGSGHFHDAVVAGTRLAVKAPSGHFHLHDDCTRPIVLIAGGIGITPLLSMLNTLAHRRDPREVWLFYGVRNGTEHIMKGHLQSLRDTHPGLRLHLCYGDPSEQDRAGVDYDHRGWLDIHLLRQTLPFGRYAFYVCGPPPMMETLIPALEAAGVSPEDIHYETFGPASLKRRPASSDAPAVSTAEVRFSRSGKTLPWGSAGSLLELAEDAGIAVESGCRAGSCGCCQTALESGEVRYSQTPDAEIAPGHCLLCIAEPTTDVTLKL
ncbi:2Fe-2S iron-sulfur cluster binding domain-containing protein [Thiorhodococcus mannitoliphagus]|uniref:nitric oxide dioxygenase n=1 Tax=Thiorhodococcus mannitoliphagus TaxID=329406 RepID=A0A6P1DXY3_9GAMM|nr:2Fe-2S iron-sulfur cluster-binding protein [Thiorhodococcus mannitoliphagus]NEX22559.1 2Fe-2S iron-sulfur cluster binding domain-containing protein [Thiorhodococcus mannitoliphagus]